LQQHIWQRILGATRLRRPLALVWESARGWTIASLVLMVVQALLPLAVLYLVKLTVDSVAAGITSPDKIAALREVLLLIALTGLVTLLIAACRALAEVIQEHQGQLVTDHVTDTIHRQSAAVDLAYYEDHRYHDTFYRAQREAPYRPTRIVRELTQLAQNSISLVALAGLLFFLHWAVALILFVTVLPVIIVKIGHANRLYAWQTHRTETERRVYDYHRMLTDIFHAKELRLFDLGNFFRKRHRDMRETLRGERLQLAKTRTKFDLAAQALAVIALFGMLAFIAWQTLQGSMTLGDMVMYHQAFQRAQTALQGIMGGLAGLYEDNLFLKHFYGFLDLKPKISSPEKTAAPPRPMRKGITFQNVSFRYPNAERDALQEVDLHISPGEVIALVGDNGAGKTTLAKLLCRLYDPVSGRICIDGNDYRSIDARQLRREITVIFQDYIQYPLSARENIWIGDVALDPTDKRIELAARQAGAEGVIGRLSSGYETILGKRFEKGEEISIGEWQKIALSRAFLRDAQLIILDEPTSAMSVRAEYEIFQSFKELLNGRAAVLISHRFSTVRIADLICVMEEGRIVERGSHEELINAGGRYAQLYNMQAQYYR
jgi:ATP-binding cassette, subfamily B, bacterial